MAKYNDLTGKTFGRLTVIDRVANDKQGNARWNCLCSCGTHKIVRGRTLITGKTLSCGCLLSEASSKRMTALATKHGLCKTPLYRVYYSMISRCKNPADKGYHRYGGRGITVCEEWTSGFEHFYHWAISNGYRRGLEIDRRNNDGPYSPENCRWITSFENCNNTRTCIKVEAIDRNGNHTVYTSINDASRHTGVSASTVSRAVHGFDVKQTTFKFLRSV